MWTKNSDMETKEMSTYGGKQRKFSDVETEAIYIHEKQSQFRYGNKSKKILIIAEKKTIVNLLL